jgi:hypothetical protein
MLANPQVTSPNGGVSGGFMLGEPSLYIKIYIKEYHGYSVVTLYTVQIYWLHIPMFIYQMPVVD